MSDTVKSNVLRLTAKIVSAHTGRNVVEAHALPALIHSVFDALAMAAKIKFQPEVQLPAVPTKKSVFPYYLVCLEDGKKLKMLKRHLMTSYGMTPDQYRAKWGLPDTYPMVAPSYASYRSMLAKSIGLGQTTGAIAAAEPEPVVTVFPARRARGIREDRVPGAERLIGADQLE